MDTQGVLVAGCVALFAIIYFSSDQTGEVGTILESTTGERTFKVVTGDLSIEYEIEPSSRQLDLVAAAIRPALRNESGILSTLHSLSLKSAQNFRSKYPGSKKCPAPYFNRHAKRYSLMASDPGLASELRRWDQPKYAMVANWERLTLVGQCLTKIRAIHKNGKDISASVRTNARQFKNCKSFLVESIVREPISDL